MMKGETVGVILLGSNPMLDDIERVRKNVGQATTEDLLDRITAYSEGMESEALAIIFRDYYKPEVSMTARSWPS